MKAPATNADLGLPFGKMTTLKVAFDVDGTLRCNCTETCQDPNWNIVTMFQLLSKFKNTDMYVWSGGGKPYAERFARLYKLNVKESHCLSKFGAPRMDICFDDIQDTAMATHNLIVREK